MRLINLQITLLALAALILVGAARVAAPPESTQRVCREAAPTDRVLRSACREIGA